MNSAAPIGVDWNDVLCHIFETVWKMKLNKSQREQVRMKYGGLSDLTAGLEGAKPKHVIFWPAQCKCGHLFLEKYQFAELTKEGNIGFCWCGFCRTKLMVKTSNAEVSDAGAQRLNSQAGGFIARPVE